MRTVERKTSRLRRPPESSDNCCMPHSTGPHGQQDKGERLAFWRLVDVCGVDFGLDILALESLVRSFFFCITKNEQCIRS
jgi:hypothetical protein